MCSTKGLKYYGVIGLGLLGVLHPVRVVPKDTVDVSGRFEEQIRDVLVTVVPDVASV